VRRELAWPAPHIARLALERVLDPVALVGTLRERALDDPLDAFLRDRAEGAVGVGDLPAIEARVHELPPRAQIAKGWPAEGDASGPDDGGDQQPPQRKLSVRSPSRQAHGRE